MTGLAHWLKRLGVPDAPLPNGLVPVGSTSSALSADERDVLERAADYGARFVFFQFGGIARREPVALVFVDDGLSDAQFARLHQRLWSWGAVPLVFRKVMGRVDLLRCAHKPDFERKDGQHRYRPFKRLKLVTDIEDQLSDGPWWDATRLQTGALWDEGPVAQHLVHRTQAAHASLIKKIDDLDKAVRQLSIPDRFARRLLMMALLVGYLEDRGVLDPNVFAGTAGASLDSTVTGTRFFAVLETGDTDAVINVFDRLADKFNGDVFRLSPEQRETVHTTDLAPFARLVEGREDAAGQLSLWRRYNFADLPVELISRIYDRFIDDAGAVYTPPFLARVLVGEVLDTDRCTRVLARDEVILDPACGSGVFLVEAFRRLILHWRQQNDWAKPDVVTLRKLLRHIHGVDKDAAAVELSAFSLCIAVCDALDSEVVRASNGLFPSLQGRQLHASCFFDWLDAGHGLRTGVVLGNPPFRSALDSEGAEAHAHLFRETVGVKVADKQIAYLFLQRCLASLAPGGVLAMIQPHGFLYNEKPRPLRAHLFATWDLREVIDLVRVSGLFKGAKTNAICLIFEAQPPPAGSRKILHITPARTVRAVTKQGLDVDYYDLHWLDRTDDLSASMTWRCGLMGGRRTLAFAQRLKGLPTLADLANRRDWPRPTEGYIKGRRDIDRGKAGFLRGKPLVPPRAISGGQIDDTELEVVTDWPIEEPRSKEHFTGPLLLIREHKNLDYAFIESGFFAFKDEVVGIAAPETDIDSLRKLAIWLGENSDALRAYAHIICSRLFARRWTSLAQKTVISLPVPEGYDLRLSDNEHIIARDVVGPYSDLIRLGPASRAAQRVSEEDLSLFSQTYARQVSLIYPGLQVLPAQRWSGLVCQPFAFGDARVDWSSTEEMQEHLHRLTHVTHTPEMHLRRIVRLYDGRFIFMLKPDVLRFWLRSIALRDADETLTDLTSRALEC